MRIALVGSSFSGKTTLTKALQAHGWYYANYTDLLKHLAATALNAIAEEMFPDDYDALELTTDDIRARKREFRPFINELGTALGFDEGYGIDKVIAKWAAKGSPEPIVWDCVRFEPQAERLRELGFVMVGLAVADWELQQRALDCGVTREEFARQHAWDEANLPEPDFVLDGELTTNQQVEKLNRLAGVQNGKRTEAA